MVILEELISKVKEACGLFPDSRQVGSRKKYSMLDAGMSAFALFFMQSGSFLNFQRELEKQEGKSNCETLFGMKGIPSDNQIRNLLDPVEPFHLDPVFKEAVKRLDEAGGLKPFQLLNGRLVIAIDGTEYFCSSQISCPHCLQRKRTNGEVEYYHSMVNAVIVQPGQSNGILLPPEFIAPQDGQTKQDCERNAAERWIERHANFLNVYRPLFVADDLFSHQPFVQVLRKHGFDCVIVCKPTSHATLSAWLDSTPKSSVTLTERKGKANRTVFYEWVNDVPLRKDDQGVRVNWLRVVEKEGVRVVYSNSFITTLRVDRDNVAELVLCARSKWHIENGSFNILKNNGYELARNYGHGQQFLAMLFVTLNLLAFTIHNICDRIETLWQQARLAKHIAIRKNFFEKLRTYTSIRIFRSWQQLLAILSGLESWDPPARAEL